jgi:CBS domain-containing protein
MHAFRAQEDMMKVSAAMHSKADWVQHDTPIAAVAEMMKKDDVGAVPVGRDDRLVGMITDRDIAIRVVAEGRDPRKTPAAEVMTPGIHYCQTGQSIDEAIRIMEDKQVRRLPVLNEKKRLVGMLALGDIAHRAGNEASGALLRAVSGHHA